VTAPQGATNGSEVSAAEATGQFLGLTPQRAARWSEVASRVVIERPRPTGRGFEALLKRARYLWTARRLRLDALGSSAWRRVDGRLTVAQIAETLRGEFGETAEPVEERVALFLSFLHREELLVFWESDDSPSDPP